jgi:NAD(P)-dependent dehydrogenase (short-subunit alcohol dehydrogenase family)
MSVAVVTGASTGIGQATAVRLGREHDTVWGALRNPDGADELRKAAADSGVDDLRLVRLDVDDDASVEEAFGQIFAESGEVDVLVNNAGISGAGVIEEAPLDEFRRQMETNFFGVLRCTQAVLPSMRERRSGCIVNVSSIAGRFIRSGMGIYSASKHAVEAISETMALEVAPFDIRVVIIEPGVIRTPIWTKAAPPDPDTAYSHVNEKTMAYFAKMLQTPAPPELVADVIADAIVTDEPRLRYVVGWEAEAIAEVRPTLADEDLVAMARLEGDEWKAEWEKQFGFSL